MSTHPAMSDAYPEDGLICSDPTVPTGADGAGLGATPCSANQHRITNALTKRGYAVRAVTWNPIRSGGIMCGPEGGWTVELALPWPDGSDGWILGYNVREVLARIVNLPQNASVEAAKD